MLLGNTAYCVQLSGEDLLHYSNKIESVGLRKCFYLWPPYVIGQAIYIFILSFVLSSSFFLSSPNLSHRRLDVYHTYTHGVALVRI